MPFEKVYVVDFKNGNLTPRIKTLTAAPMELMPGSVGTPNLSGLIFETDSSAGVFVRSTSGISIESRVMVEAAFDIPKELAGVPDLWAAWVSIGDDENALAQANTKAITVSCQFNRQRPPTGVRLNTPGSLEKPPPPPDRDQASFLDEQLNLARYNGSDPSQFTLSLSFCGVRSALRGHTSGSSFLRIKDKNKPLRDDHRVFTSATLLPNTVISCLGAGVELAAGGDLVSLRLRRFSIFINKPLP